MKVVPPTLTPPAGAVLKLDAVEVIFRLAEVNWACSPEVPRKLTNRDRRKRRFMVCRCFLFFMVMHLLDSAASDFSIGKQRPDALEWPLESVFSKGGRKSAWKESADATTFNFEDSEL